MANTQRSGRQGVKRRATDDIASTSSNPINPVVRGYQNDSSVNNDAQFYVVEEPTNGDVQILTEHQPPSVERSCEDQTPIDQPSNDFYVTEEANSSEIPSTLNTEESFVLSSKMGEITVTLEDLKKVGVNINEHTFSVDQNQVDLLMKLFYHRLNNSKNVEFNESQEPTTSKEKEVRSENEHFYAYVGDNGSVSLIQENSGKTIVCYEPEELRQMGIKDATQLNEEDLRRLEYAVSGEQRSQTSLTSTVTLGVPRQNEIHANKTVDTSADNSKDDGFIGEEIEVVTERFPTPRSAIIRYARKSGMFKVQYENGRFEWITKTQIRQKSAPRKANEKKRNAGDKSSQTEMSTSANRIQRSSILHPNHDYCAICDKKIATQQPAFIVIRLPACRPCSMQKAMFVEETQTLSEQNLKNIQKVKIQLRDRTSK
ncbi:hypothetical protein M3Y95_01121600 [Aphelenchoides besseyi]|nr:hypothetical protein M3Y95_01121600 [Aphelenchoides besseyi]